MTPLRRFFVTRVLAMLALAFMFVTAVGVARAAPAADLAAVAAQPAR